MVTTVPTHCLLAPFPISFARYGYTADAFPHTLPTPGSPFTTGPTFILPVAVTLLRTHSFYRFTLHFTTAFRFTPLHALTIYVRFTAPFTYYAHPFTTVPTVTTSFHAVATVSAFFCTFGLTGFCLPFCVVTFLWDSHVTFVRYTHLPLCLITRDPYTPHTHTPTPLHIFCHTTYGLLHTPTDRLRYVHHRLHRVPHLVCYLPAVPTPPTPRTPLPVRFTPLRLLHYLLPTFHWICRIAVTCLVGYTQDHA